MGRKKHKHFFHAPEEDAPIIGAWFHLEISRCGFGAADTFEGASSFNDAAKKKIISKPNNFILVFYLHSTLTPHKMMVLCFPRATRSSCLSFILPSVAATCFWLVVVFKLINRQPSIAKAPPISLFFSPLHLTPQTMGNPHTFRPGCIPL